MEIDSCPSATLAERVRRLEALAEVQASLAEADLGLDEFMQAVIDELGRLVGAAGVVIEIPDGDAMVYRAATGRLAQVLGMRTTRAGSLSGLCIELVETLLCHDTQSDHRVDRAACERTGIRSMICAPLIQRGKAVGALKVCADRPNAFTDDDIHALRLLTATLAAEMGKQVRFERTERLLADRTEATLSLARQVGERMELEASLRANEQRLAGIIANAHQAILTMTDKGVITCWNRQAELTFGWSEEEALGREMAELIVPPELRRLHSAGLRGFLETAESKLIGQRIEVAALHRDGTRFPIELAINAARVGDGWEFTALLHDISERRTKTELFENGFNHAPIGMALVSLAGNFLKVNEAFCRITGYSAEEAQALDFQAITHPDDLALDLDHVERLRRRELTSYKIDKRYLSKDGESVSVRLSVSMVEAEDGTPEHFIAQVEDLTKERDAQNRYRLMAHNSTDIIVTIDFQGRITFLSPACERILGISHEAWLGRPCEALVHPDDLPPVRRAYMRLLGRGDEARVRWRGRHQSGHWVWLESSPALLRDGADEAVNGFIDVIRDITERKEREDALAAARLAAEEAVRSKSDFVANVSHELRTPLNSIIGFSRLLTEGAGLNEEAQRRVRLIHSAGQALQSVIDNVLDFSKLEAAALELNCAPFDLRAFIPETIALLEPQAAARDLPLRALVAPDVPAWVVGDEGRLRQVLLNLLSNAVKFTREGHVEVRLRPVPIESGEARLRVEVRDTGSGISQQRLDTLFSRFVQAAPSVAAHYGGTGLGLAITRQLVDLMGGEIGVESRVGAGSTFWFEVVLPIAAASAPAQDERSPGESWRGKHILVVDDVDLNRDLMLATLSSYGCAVEAANDGAQAVAAVLARPFDLVLMDCQMPVMDGFAATEAIRAAGPPHNATPIVALTASAQSAHIERCRESGMDDHLSKPLNEKLLEQILARYLSARPAHSDEEPGMPVTTEKPSLEERYRARKLSTLEKINAMIRAGRFGDDERAEIAALSHQLAGTAALFGDPALGEEARALEIGLERWSAEERPAAVRASYEKLRLAA